MKIITFIVRLLTWPFVLVMLVFMATAWFILYSWGCRDYNYMATDEIRTLAYCVRHMRLKKK